MSEFSSTIFRKWHKNGIFRGFNPFFSRKPYVRKRFVFQHVSVQLENFSKMLQKRYFQGLQSPFPRKPNVMERFVFQHVSVQLYNFSKMVKKRYFQGFQSLFSQKPDVMERFVFSAEIDFGAIGLEPSYLDKKSLKFAGLCYQFHQGDSYCRKEGGI